MGPLEAALVSLALLVGATGTWSPCGFSMVETIGPTGHTGGRRTTIAACATFLPGALVGGALTFGSLAALGELVHGAPGRIAYLAAAGIALAAAALEARGARIVPQVRRQLPERWRRRMPMPVAAGLYGVLLGLGFTTFVLTFGVWALAAVCFAVGEPGIGLLVGLAFGAGRAGPICALAPVADRPLGRRAMELMAMRPGLYRAARLGDAAALVLAAGALGTTGAATAADVARRDAADPSVKARQLAFQLQPGRDGVLASPDGERELAGKDPALGGPYAAVIRGDRIVLLDRKELTERRRVRAEDADAVAVSGQWLVWRRHLEDRDALLAKRIGDLTDLGRVKKLDAARGANQLGRPALDGRWLAYAVAKRGRNQIVVRRLPGGKPRTVLGSRRVGLSNPALRDGRLLYVRHGRRGDRLMLKALGKRGKGCAIYAKRRGTLWSTALGAGRAHVTHLRGAQPRVKLIRIGF